VGASPGYQLGKQFEQPKVSMTPSVGISRRALIASATGVRKDALELV
jgi:hypothetical protein